MTPQNPEKPEASATEVTNAKRDLRQEVTDQMIQMLETGTAPWQKPWKAGSLGMPFNPTTENAYRGGNAIHLMATGLQRGYEDPRWLTYKQAVENGWQIRKGEKGTQIEYWEYPARQTAGKEATDRPADKVSDRDQRPIHRVYTVFNGQQVDGIPAYQSKEHPEWEVIQGAEQILENSGAKILHDRNDEAFYSRVNDRIHLPPKTAFQKPADYYGTALHELAHWSGHPERLDRQTLTSSYRFGDTNYAKEELRAELTSVFLSAERGIPHDTARHAAYVGSWIQGLKDDKNEIFRAARDANRAADFLLALEREKSVAKALDTLDRPPHRDAPDRAPETGAGTNASSPGAPKHRNNKESSGVAGMDESLSEVKTLSLRALGDNARVYNARTDSGIYRGEIIGETQHHIVQKLGPRSTVAHLKQLLGTVPGVGQNVAIHYSNGKILDVAQFQPKAQAKELAR
jgi:antirestriction protein ArdC